MAQSDPNALLFFQQLLPDRSASDLEALLAAHNGDVDAALDHALSEALIASTANDEDDETQAAAAVMALDVTPETAPVSQRDQDPVTGTLVGDPGVPESTSSRRIFAMDAFAVEDARGGRRGHVRDQTQFDSDLIVLSDVFPSFPLDVLAQMLTGMPSAEHVIECLIAESDSSSSDEEHKFATDAGECENDDDGDDDAYGAADQAAPQVLQNHPSRHGGAGQERRRGPRESASTMQTPFVSAWAPRSVRMANSTTLPPAREEALGQASRQASAVQPAAIAGAPKPIDMSDSCDTSRTLHSAASVLKRSQLRDDFPEASSDTVDAVFVQCGYDFGASSARLSEMFPQAAKRKPSYPAAVRAGGQSVPSGLTRGVASSPSVPTHTAAWVGTSFPSSSASPATHHTIAVHEDARAHYLQRAAAAHANATSRNGGASVAGHYSQQAHHHTQELKRAAQQAAVEMARASIRSSTAPSIDLHGYGVADAVAAVQAVLNELHQRAKQDDSFMSHRGGRSGGNRNNSGDAGTLRIITGRGAHSVAGKAKLRPAVRVLIDSLRFPYSEPQTGVFWVDYTRKIR
ncbi:hypothetical protein CAOG_02289 [Capsaspora owczarzaki ATCC 30864]|uniref:hypothetical protein n=1 Tax=Capsaspora owczarzaki (strain ATCC 30864) TaxID=595528 RepID=UPI0001FE327C|nr:hypothetical protein CAOG_02289 [Capsaspora owczarzaki ATCC 30864]|eukprot:XP_004349039.1 hypothetical protein CAOG_02289 [Capsaspora owczarzaki ATCC 30864]